LPPPAALGRGKKKNKHNNKTQTDAHILKMKKQYFREKREGREMQNQVILKPSENKLK